MAVKGAACRGGTGAGAGSLEQDTGETQQRQEHRITYISVPADADVETL